jgi:hypothetical protein
MASRFAATIITTVNATGISSALSGDNYHMYIQRGKCISLGWGNKKRFHLYNKASMMEIIHIPLHSIQKTKSAVFWDEVAWRFLLFSGMRWHGGSSTTPVFIY